MKGQAIQAIRDDRIYDECARIKGRGIIFAADPSIAHPALAAIYIDGRKPGTLYSKLVNLKSVSLKGDDTDRIVQQIEMVAQFLGGTFAHFLGDFDYFIVAVEKSDSWLRGGNRGRGVNAKAMQQVARSGGAIEGSLVSGLDPLINTVHVVAPLVSAWKGNAPKDFTKKKIEKVFPCAYEVKGKRLNEHDRDACGVALYVVDRLLQSRGIPV